MKRVYEPTPACLSLEQLEALIEANTAPGWEHLQGCARCLAEMQLLKEFAQAEPAAAERADVDWITARLRQQGTTRPAVAEKPASWWERLWQSLTMPQTLAAVAMTAVVVLGVSGYLLRERTVVTPDSDLVRSSQLTAVSPADALAQPPAQFVWEAKPAAASYEVIVMEVDGRPIWRTAATAASAPADETLRALCKPGKTLLWKVIAKGPGGQILGESAPQTFVVR